MLQSGPLWHGSADPELQPCKGGLWFSSSLETAAAYGPVIHSGIITLHNPMIVDCDSSGWDEIDFEGRSFNSEDIFAVAIKRGHDGVIFLNVNDHPADCWSFSNVWVVDDPASVSITLASNANVTSYDRMEP